MELENVSLEQLQQLIAVSRYGTISAAADKLGVSQPTLSRSLKRLEQELPCSIFTRNQNKVEFNQYGELVLRYAQVMVKTTQDMQHDLEDKLFASAAPVVACAGTSGLLNFKARLMERYPYLELNVVPVAEPSAQELFESGEAAVVISAGNSGGPGLKSVALTKETLCVNVAASHSLSRKMAITLADLAGQEIVAYQGDAYAIALLQKAGANVIAEKSLKTYLARLSGAFGVEDKVFLTSTAACYQGKTPYNTFTLKGEDATITYYAVAPKDSSAVGYEYVAALEG